MLVRIEAFLRKARHKLSRSVWMARLLNLPSAPDPRAAAGLVMIQIDGLSFTQLERAIRKKHLPFLERLIKKEGYLKYRHYPGLPSNTPAVQGALFYGVKGCVPAFSFQSHESGHISNMFNPDAAREVEGYLNEKDEGLLKGGSAYGNIFTGGAKEAHFCASSIGWGSLLKAVSPLGLPVTVLLNIHIFVRAFFLTFVEIFLAFWDLARGVFAGQNFFTELRFIPMRVSICILLREVIALGARVDIARGLPVVHVNFAGYDEQAHHRGPTSKFAHWSLEGIDSAIRTIWHAAQSSRHRHYDFFVYSDHGQEETVPYNSITGQSIQEVVTKIFGRWHTFFSVHEPYWRADLLRNKSRVPVQQTAEQAKQESDKLAVHVAAMGNVGHIYLPERISEEEQEKLASELVSMGQVPTVMAMAGDGKAWLWNRNGKFLMPDEAAKVLPADHPFLKEVPVDLAALCHHPDSGNFVILGWHNGAKSITFQNGEHGSHAGPGSEETSGFALLPVDALTFTGELSHKFTIYTEEIRRAAIHALGRDEYKFSINKNPKERHLRVMTYNVHGCMGRDGKTAPHRIARIIARYSPDIVAIQELHMRDAAKQAEIIADKLGMNFYFDSPSAPELGRIGNTVMSHFPMRLVRAAQLPKLSERSRLLEPRGAVWAEIDFEGQKIQVINTHLSLSSAEGLKQVKNLLGADWMGNEACVPPVIFCGDLNAFPDSKICGQLARKLKNVQGPSQRQRTLPSFYPLGLVDHIFISNEFEIKRVEVPHTELERVSSDHLPVIAELELKLTKLPMVE